MLFRSILAYRRQDLISCGFFFVYSIAEFDTWELLSFGENCAILQTGNTTVRFLPTAHRSGRWGTTLLPFLPCLYSITGLPCCPRRKGGTGRPVYERAFSMISYTSLTSFSNSMIPCPVVLYPLRSYRQTAGRDASKTANRYFFAISPSKHPII